MYAFKFLESLYEKYNNLSKAQEDPVRFLHCFNDIRAREIIGIVSSSLAFGRVSQIIDSVGKNHIHTRRRSSGLRSKDASRNLNG